MKFLIHTCLLREWYVRRHLVPSMLAQGIPESDIEVWVDFERLGNLRAFVHTMRECGKRKGATWHLQDDVIISRRFFEVCQQYDEGIVCGFATAAYVKSGMFPGYVSPHFMWYSFPCIHIPNELAAEFAEWYDEASRRECYRVWVEKNKFDDSFFREFLIERHKNIKALNLAPNLVNHVDYLIGGSSINPTRRDRAVSVYWDDDDLVENLSKQLK